ncbi:hypothetical protein FLTE109939_01490 [Flavobacterium terrigena]
MSNFETKLNQNNPPDIGRIIDESFSIFKKTVWISGVCVFLWCLFIVPITFIVIFKSLDISSLDEFVKISPTLGENMDYMLINAAVGIPMAGLTAIITAGFYKINHLAKQDKEFGLNNLFDYFKSPYLMNLFICGFLTALYSDILGLGLIYLNIPIGATIIQAFISFLFILSIPLIIFENQTALQAMSNSSKLAMKHPFTIILCLVFGIIIAMLGIFALCIGIFFTIGYIYAMNYTLYSHIIPIETPNENKHSDDFGQE